MAGREPSLAPPASSSSHIEEIAPVLAGEGEGESSVGGGLGGGGEGNGGGGSSASSQLKVTGSGVFLVLDGGNSAAKWDARLHTVRPHSAPAPPGPTQALRSWLGASSAVHRAHIRGARLAPTYEPYTPSPQLIVPALCALQVGGARTRRAAMGVPQPTARRRPDPAQGRVEGVATARTWPPAARTSPPAYDSRHTREQQLLHGHPPMLQ